MVKRNAVQGLGVRVPTGVDLPIRRGADEIAGGDDLAPSRRRERPADFYHEALQTGGLAVVKDGGLAAHDDHPKILPKARALGDATPFLEARAAVDDREEFVVQLADLEVGSDMEILLLSGRGDRAVGGAAPRIGMVACGLSSAE